MKGEINNYHISAREPIMGYRWERAARI